MAVLSLQDIFASLSSFMLFLSVFLSPSFQLTLMPDAVLVREQGDGGSLIDGDIVGGRMDLLIKGDFGDGLGCTPLGRDPNPYSSCRTFFIHFRCAAFMSPGISKHFT
jgi:hypothetical protein